MSSGLSTGQWLVAALLPVLMASSLTIFWMQTGRIPIGGDEPHYLIMAVSLIEDGDLRLKNNYEIECVANEIYGCMTPHAFQFEHAWVPYHQAGLSVLIAPFYSIARIGGARLTTVAIAAMLPLLLVLWFQRLLPARDAVTSTLAACLSVPFLFGASTLYPDLPAGVMVLGLSTWLLRVGDDPSRPRSPLSWVGFWLLAGLLCWLNLKFILATTILGGWALVVLRRSGSWTLRPAHYAAVAALIGPMTLAAFHYWGFGNILGGRGSGELTSSPARALLFFLGLHLDQAQGMFVQHPFLLAGVPALVIWGRRRPTDALFWTMLYLSLVATNSLQMGRYGGEGPAGRYGWTAAWLWMIPVAYAAAHYALLLRRWCIAAIAYQGLLAIRWVPTPLTLYPIYEEQLSARNSLFPESLRVALPSFYDWSYASYLGYPQNIVGILAIGVLLAVGWRHSRRANSITSPHAGHPRLHADT